MVEMEAPLEAPLELLWREMEPKYACYTVSKAKVGVFECERCG